MDVEESSIDQKKKKKGEDYVRVCLPPLFFSCDCLPNHMVLMWSLKQGVSTWPKLNWWIFCSRALGLRPQDLQSVVEVVKYKASVVGKHILHKWLTPVHCQREWQHKEEKKRLPAFEAQASILTEVQLAFYFKWDQVPWL